MNRKLSYIFRKNAVACHIHFWIGSWKQAETTLESRRDLLVKLEQKGEIQQPPLLVTGRPQGKTLWDYLREIENLKTPEPYEPVRLNCYIPCATIFLSRP